jgi:hypothetical protein
MSPTLFVSRLTRPTSRAAVVAFVSKSASCTRNDTPGIVVKLIRRFYKATVPPVRHTERRTADDSDGDHPRHRVRRYFPLLKYETQSPWFLNGPGGPVNDCQPPSLHESALSYVKVVLLIWVLSNCAVMYGVVNPSTTS